MVLRENVDLTDLDSRKLTNDCKLVGRSNGTVDLVKEFSSVRIFDHYWDRGIQIKKIWHAGGSRNPKTQQPEF